MRMHCFMPLLAALALLHPAAATAQTPDGQSNLAENAALQYWQGFAKMATLDKDQEKLLDQWRTVSLDDPAVTELLAESQTSLMYLHRGAALPRCDWGLDYNDGVSMLMPHLGKARELARLAALDSRRAFAAGDWKAGSRDAHSMMALGRHVGHDTVIIALLVRLVIEDMVVDCVAPYVPEFKAPYTEASAAFAALPPATTLAESILFEKKWMGGWIVPKVRDAEEKQKGGGLELWKSLLNDGAPKALRNMESIDEIAKLMEAGLPIYDELARLVSLPNDQFEVQYPPFKQKANAEHSLAALIMPSIEQVRAKDQRQQARLGMLMAGIAVAESGPGKLKEIKSPFGPYEYRALDKGFELKSKVRFEGQPVTLTIGQHD